MDGWSRAERRVYLKIINQEFPLVSYSSSSIVMNFVSFGCCRRSRRRYRCCIVTASYRSNTLFSPFNYHIFQAWVPSIFIVLLLPSSFSHTFTSPVRVTASWFVILIHFYCANEKQRHCARALLWWNNSNNNMEKWIRMKKKRTESKESKPRRFCCFRLSANFQRAAN